ncbi:DsbC family protein [Gilvimarinus sp. F26214L]|uniref:DsbC family protein n=1 Tax=Gilvimarinus sp. DZF01 TaxID=3461371 RepID=UPI0040465E1A
MKITRKLVKPILLSMALFVAGPALAVGPAPEVTKRILSNLEEARGDLEYAGVKVSPIPGLYEVQVLGGPTLYVTEDASFFVAGDLFRIREEGFVNIQEQARAKERARLLAAVKKEDQIIFSPDGETKAYVNVFTDVDCGYCQKLHREIDQINALGIEVRYLAYPRAGAKSQSADKLATAWCSSDPKATLTKLKNRESVAMEVCEDNPIADHYRLGGLVGVSGTPNMVTADGQMIGGYVPAAELAARLGLSGE